MRRSRDPLSEALREWRSADNCDERFSETGRARILHAARSAAVGGRQRPLNPLFLPLRGWALAGALPVALLTLALGYGLWPAGGPPGGDEAAPLLQAQRVGNEVVFVIANGGRPHSVYRSDRPDSSGPGEPVSVTQGRFRDRLDAGGNLVFYRID